MQQAQWGEAASDCFWTPLILISVSKSDSFYAQSELTHILPATVIQALKETNRNKAKEVFASWKSPGTSLCVISTMDWEQIR